MLSFRRYQGWDDLRAFRRLLGEGLRDAPERGYVHPGDVAWWIGWPPPTPERLGETLVAEDAGRLVGFAVLDDGEVGEFVAPDLLGSAVEDAFWDGVGEWLASQDEGVRRYAYEDDERTIERLERAGWRPRADDGLLCFARPLRDLPQRDGTDVRPVGAQDVEARLSITHAAFGVERPFARYVEEYRAFMASPAYPDGWDLVAWTPEGEAAACCIAWTDPVSGVGNLEPVATHPRHARQGYGTAVVSEAFRRFAAAGMTDAIVRTWILNDGAEALYRSVGFVQTHVERAYAGPTRPPR